MSRIRRSAALSQLLPGGIVAFETDAGGDLQLLTDAEQTLVQRASLRRQIEFAAGRECARTALAALGTPTLGLAADADGCPLWPEGLTGSITHTEGYCAAAVAKRSHVQALGIDAERVQKVSPDLWGDICTPTELESLRAMSKSWQNRFAALAFSAKEALYKAQFSLTREWLDHHDLSLGGRLSASDAGFFHLVAQRPLRIGQVAPGPWKGRYLFSDDLILTAIAWPTETSA